MQSMGGGRNATCASIRPLTRKSQRFTIGLELLLRGIEYILRLLDTVKVSHTVALVRRKLLLALTQIFYN